MPVYLFSSKGLAAFAAYLSPDTLFAFDLDGTLAPIVEDYSAAQLDEQIRITLQRLIRLAKVAVITGRSRQDAMAILGVEPHLLIGNHGAEWSSVPNSSFIQDCNSWQEQLQKELRDVQGLEFEPKGESLSLHYRKADDRESALERIDAAVTKLEPGPRSIGGKFVVNLLPMTAPTKGDALLAAMDQLVVRRSVFIGDDVTDEEVFLLKNADIFGIHIGGESRTAASYYINNQSEMPAILNLITTTLNTMSSYQQ